MASVDAPPSPSASKRDTSDASDLDPADFLKSIRELSAQREREDSERYRKLEEEVERSRAERKARRAGVYLFILRLLLRLVYSKAFAGWWS